MANAINSPTNNTSGGLSIPLAQTPIENNSVNFEEKRRIQEELKKSQLLSRLNIAPENEEGEDNTPEINKDYFKGSRADLNQNVGALSKAKPFFGKSKKLKNLYKLRKKLLKQIHDGQFTWGSFISISMLVWAKEIMDGIKPAILAIPFIGEIAFPTFFVFNFAVSTIFLAYFFTRKPYFRKWMRRKQLGKMFITAIIELIPFLNILPTFVLQVIWIRYEAEKHISKKRNKLTSVNKKIMQTEKKELKEKKKNNIFQKMKMAA